MNKPKALLYFFIVSGFLFLTGFLQTSPQVNDNSLEINFPEEVIFHIDVSHSASIQRITLIYGTNGRTCQTSTARQNLDFEPGSQVTASWNWEFKRSGTLPPGVEIWWEWEIEDDAGNIFTIPQQTATVQDQRKNWKIVDKNNVYVQWYTGDDAFGQAMHAIALDSLDRLETQMGIRPVDKIFLTVYPTAEETRDAVYYSPEWMGGRAFPEYNATLIGVAPGQLDWAAQIIPHELTHLVVGALTFNCKAVYLPTWLDEGLAEVVEGSVGEMARNAVLKALEDDTLPRLSSLEHGFSAFAGDANLSYWQSNFVVQYMLDEYGPEKMAEFLATMQAGEKIESALTLVYGLSTDSLDRDWRASWGFDFLFQESTPESKPTPTLVPTLSLINPVFPTATETPLTATATDLPTLVPSPTLPATPPPPEATAPPELVSPPAMPETNPFPILGVLLVGIFIVLLIGLGFIMSKRRK